MRHRATFPPRYRKLCSDTSAHSDNEYDPEKRVYVIKTLGYRSKNVSKFFRRLDVEMIKEMEVNGKASRRRIRKLPKVPIASEFKRAPRNLPIEFYDPTWFKQLAPGQKRLMVDSENVALLPDASQSLLPTRHVDEKLSDARFTAKYLDAITEPYELTDEEGEEVEDEEDEEEEDEDEELNSQDEEAKEEEDDGLFDEGECGGLYDDEAEEEEE